MKEIPLTRGYVALVDDEDYERVSQFKWYASVRRKTVYAQREVGGTAQKMHRLILGLEPGDKSLVDHVDHNGLNNCRSNIRVCTHAENQRNVEKHCDNTSGWKGVIWHKKGQKFAARLRVNSKNIHLGLFHSPISAALEYDRAARKYHGSFACLNFPGMCAA